MPHHAHDISIANPVCKWCGVTVTRLMTTAPPFTSCPAPAYPWPLIGAR